MQQAPAVTAAQTADGLLARRIAAMQGQARLDLEHRRGRLAGQLQLAGIQAVGPAHARDQYAALRIGDEGINLVAGDAAVAVQRVPLPAVVQVQQAAAAIAGQQLAIVQFVQGVDAAVASRQVNRFQLVVSHPPQAVVTGDVDIPVGVLQQGAYFPVRAVVMTGQALQCLTRQLAVQAPGGAQPETAITAAQESIGARVAQRLQPGYRSRQTILVSVDTARGAQPQPLAFREQAVDVGQAAGAGYRYL